MEFYGQHKGTKIAKVGATVSWRVHSTMANKMADQQTSFDLKRKLIETTYFASAFFVLRYPYVCAVLLMLTTGELMKSSVNVPNSRISMAYAHLGMFFLSGTAMAFNLFGTKRLFALVSAAQLAFRSYEVYMTGAKTDSALVRILSRNIALVGCYLMVAGGLADFERGAQRHRRLLQSGLQMLGVHSFISAAILWNSPTEFNAHVSHLPGGTFTTYLWILLYIMTGMCLYGSYKVLHFAKLLAWLLVVVTVFVDIDSKYWWSSANVSHWMVMTIASKNACVIFTLLLVRGVTH